MAACCAVKRGSVSRRIVSCHLLILLRTVGYRTGLEVAMRCGREVSRLGCAWKTCLVYNRSFASSCIFLHVDKMAVCTGEGVGSRDVVAKSTRRRGVPAQSKSS